MVQAGMASPGGGVAVAAEVTLSGHTHEEKSLLQPVLPWGRGGGQVHRGSARLGKKWHVAVALVNGSCRPFSFTN